jgi:hypothetical protein
MFLIFSVNLMYNLSGRQLPYDVLLFACEVLDEMPVRATICVVLPEITGYRWRIIWIHPRFHDDFVRGRELCAFNICNA